MMASSAWASVSKDTIKHCWDHTQIRQQVSHSTPNPSCAPSSSTPDRPYADPTAWNVIREFAVTEMTLPEAEKRLQDILTTHYVDTDWRPALDAVMQAEGDSDAAVAAVETLATSASNRTGLKIRIPARPPPQLVTLENEVSSYLTELKSRNRIFGEPMALDNFLEPAEEAEVPDPLDFSGGDEAIVAQVHQEIAEGNGEVIEVESEDECEAEQEISATETLALCKRLEPACLQFTDLDSQVTLDLLKHLRLFRGRLQRVVDRNAKQTKISAFFK